MEIVETLSLVLTSWPADRDPEAFARTLVAADLAACVHVWPAGTSIYRWAGAIERADERQVLIKTVASRLPTLEATMRAEHPYELPEWIVLTGEASAAYLGWVVGAVGGAVGGDA